MKTDHPLDLINRPLLLFLYAMLTAFVAFGGGYIWLAYVAAGSLVLSIVTAIHGVWRLFKIANSTKVILSISVTEEPSKHGKVLADCSINDLAHAPANLNTDPQNAKHQ